MSTSEPRGGDAAAHGGFTNAIVRLFLRSHLSPVLMVFSAAVGIAALMVTPREEDPQIVVPLADVHVSFPGRSAAEVEQLVATPLEKLLYQIDGVEYVYSMSREGQAVITVRYYVGEDRERSLVKLYKRIDEHIDIVPPGVAGWVVKPVEIDDVPIVSLTLTGAGGDTFALRRVAEEMVDRLAAVKDVSRAYVLGGQPRVMHVYLDPGLMQAYRIAPLDVQRRLQAANVTRTVGEFTGADEVTSVEVGRAFRGAEEIRDLVVGVVGDRPVFLKDVATVRDGAAEPTDYVRHGWGPARGFDERAGFPGATIGGRALRTGVADAADGTSQPAVTIALAKKKGTNAVTVACNVLAAAEQLKREVVPDDIEVVLTRNYGLTADEKVNELVETLIVAVVIVIALLTLGLGWRESLIVAVAVPVVFGLTLTVNLALGFTINRVTLFALILSLGLLVDDPIVDVENISRHFALRRQATPEIVLEAVAEIRPPLITATLAVIVSFLPLFFITGMMGPYMRPMALNVPVAMFMSMVVAFTITPWLSYRALRRGFTRGAGGGTDASSGHHEPDLDAVKASRLYRLFFPLMAPLLRSRRTAWTFLAVIALLTLGAVALAATRHVPLKMLPFDNKNEFLLVLDLDEGTTLERTAAAVQKFEQYLAGVPEVTCFTSYVGTPSPMDFNGLVRHYYLRHSPHQAEIQVNLAAKKNRSQQSHALVLRLRDALTALARRDGVNLKIVETPPGPPVIATLVAELYGRPDHSYENLIAAAGTVRRRATMEPAVVDVDDSVDADQHKIIFVADKQKAALNGISVAEIAETIAMALNGALGGTIHLEGERHPLRIELRVPRAQRSSQDRLAVIQVKSADGSLVPLAELGRWDEATVDQTIYHKNLQRVVYVFADTVGRAPAEAVMDIQADRVAAGAAPAGDAGRPAASAGGWVGEGPVRPPADRTFLANGGGVPWSLPDGIRVDFSGEGEWNITLDVFRDLGLAFAAALVGIYILLTAQTHSFTLPLVVMLAIPLTILGIMPGFWLLNALGGGQMGGFADPIFFTATGMIGMIALAGIVTRDSIILVDFIHLSLARGRSLFDAIMESRVVRLRPILLTAATALLSAAPIALDPIFSGLAWAIIFGLLASTVFTLFVIPVAYWLLYGGNDAADSSR
ncbi:MAG: efflux RND transporter permease subunit [Planctomycetes bacterium]|nr:efflux RND transporter permease subunit [Planctomycetota bacterium]